MSVPLRRLLNGAFAALLSGVSVGAHAVAVNYQAVDLPDLIPGEDLWEYRYTVTGTFEQFEGFNVLFSSSLYSSLDDTPTGPNADWLVSTVPIDVALPADGIYSAQALADNPSLSAPFSVSFVRLGTGTPGAQGFEVVDANFSVTQIGETTVPEPSSLVLLGAGLGLVWCRRRLQT